MLSDSDPLLPSISLPFALGLRGVSSLQSTSILELQCGSKSISAMEEVASSQSSGTFESDTNLENMESSSPASGLDDKDHFTEDGLKVVKPTSKEFKKTWGFRKTTIAKREGAGDAEMDAAESSQQATPSLRRSGRQPKRTERVEEFLTTVRRNRGRKGTNLEDLSDRSCPVTDAETASEGSVESTPDAKSDSQRMDPKAELDLECKTEPTKDDDDSSDSDGMTLKELQNRLRSRRSENVAVDTDHVQAASTLNTEPPSTVESCVRTRSANRAALAHQQMQKSPIKQEAPTLPEPEDEQPEQTEVVHRSRPESEIYDPNTLYCICRQPHNNRFMICCDRCEEWFHGTCVGISEGRGQLLEKDGEDYICPNCTILLEQSENAANNEQKEKTPRETVSCKSEPGNTSNVEQSTVDQGIKGRIEKAAHPSGKKKLKIFHPVSESPEVSKCIGPGCSNHALTDSVYCSHDCILKHAAATMKSLSASKETKPKEKVKVKAEKRTPPKPQAVPKSFDQKTVLPDKLEPLMKKVLIMIPRVEAEVAMEQKLESSGGTPSWESDHNYIAVKPEKTSAISSTLFYKCMYHLGIFPIASLSVCLVLAIPCARRYRHLIFLCIV